MTGNRHDRSGTPGVAMQEDLVASIDHIGDEFDRLLHLARVVAGSVGQRDTKHVQIGTVGVATVLPQTQHRIDVHRQRRVIEAIADRDLLNNPVHRR